MLEILSKYSRNKSTISRYFVALAATTAALIIKLNLHSINPNAVPVFFLALTISSVYGGRGPGMLSAIFISIAHLYYFVPPLNSFYITSLHALIEFVIFSVGITLMSVLTSSLYEARAQADHAREKAMEYANQKAYFVANVTHDIRTPINAVIGLSELLSGLQTLPSEAKQYISEIQNAGETLLFLVDDILDFSKLDFGKVNLEAQPFELSKQIKHCINMVSNIAEAKGITTSWKLNSSIPKILLADFSRLNQILINLLSNAVKFTENGTIVVTVKPAKQIDKKLTLRFEVIDTGIGIPKSQHGKVFEAFVQGDFSSTRRYRGTGLGLAICKKLVHVMDGDIGVQSEAGKGSTFWFEIPVEINETQSLPTTIKRIDYADPSSTVGSPKILVVEDNEISQMITLRTLFKLGYQAEAVKSGCDAVKVVSKNSYDAVLMDCHMPEMDGYTATEKIRREPRCGTLPIIALTAYASLENRELCRNAGMTDYLAKPLRIQELSFILKKWVPSQQTTDETGSNPTKLTENEPFGSVKELSLDKYLMNLHQQLGDEGYAIKELIDTFLSQTPQKLFNLQEATEKNDMKSVSALAHNLRSASGALGIFNMETLCEKIELGAQQVSFQESAPLLINQLSLEFSEAKANLLHIHSRYTQM